MTKCTLLFHDGTRQIVPFMTAAGSTTNGEGK